MKFHVFLRISLPIFPLRFLGVFPKKSRKWQCHTNPPSKCSKIFFFKISSVQNFYLVVFYGFLMSFSSYLLICETSLNLKYAVFCQKSAQNHNLYEYLCVFCAKTAYFKFKLVSQIRRYDENDIRNP